MHHALSEKDTQEHLLHFDCQTKCFTLSLGTPETFTLDVLVSLMRQENAVDICVIKVPEQIKYAQYFIVVSGVSTRHLRAMALYAIKVVTNIRLLIVKRYMCNLCLFSNLHNG